MRTLTKQNTPNIEVVEQPKFTTIDRCIKHQTEVSKFFYPTLKGECDLLLQSDKGMWFKLSNRGDYLEISYGHSDEPIKDKTWVRASEYHQNRNLYKQKAKEKQEELKKPDLHVANAQEDEVI